jgi:hypothetical protein
MISTDAQFLATIEDVLMKVDKVIHAMNANPNLQNAKRWLKDIHRVIQKNQTPSASHRKNLDKAARCLRAVPMRMPDLDNQLWDLEDYVDTL